MDNLTQQLVHRAQAVLSAPVKNYAEMGAVHGAITGTHYACTPCNERRITWTLSSFVQQPERYQLRIQQSNKEKMENKKTNYRFSAKATGQMIIVHDKNGSAVKVTPETLTDERAELVLSYPRFAHNIERIPGTEEPELAEEKTEEEEPVQDTEGQEETAEEEEAPAQEEQPVDELAAAQKRYTELKGHKPGNRSLETLLAAIAEAEAKDNE